MPTKTPFAVAAATLLLSAFAIPARADDCTALRKMNYAQGELFALIKKDGTPKIIPLRAEPFASNELEFDPGIRLIYVLDDPSTASFSSGIQRDFSGVIAGRLVSTRTSPKPQPPAYVKLWRDSLVNRRGTRAHMSGEVSASSYYIHHHPRQLRSSDSYLEREFHTAYTYKAGEPDRKTFEPRDRRSLFHFPEMREATPPNDLISTVTSKLFGSGTALAATDESGLEQGFEAQIKFYPRETQLRCVKIDTRLPLVGDSTLKITLTDLDFPGGIDVRESSDTWIITWKKSSSPSSRLP
jgi:hypothetical protein